MKEEFRSSQAFEALRQKAEKIARKRKSKMLDADELDLVRFSHELEVQRIELELQNEELRLANRELEQSRNEFADLYHSAPIAFLNLNSKGLIEKANEAAFRILPCDPNFLVGSSFARFIAAEDQRLFYSYLQELAGGKGAEPCELRILDQNEKRTLYFQLSATAKFDDKGMLDHWRLALVDTTDRKLAEKKRREARNQLQKLNQSLEKKVVERTENLEQTIRALENEIEEREKVQAELRQMTGKTIEAMEHDRRALSKEIHDSIGGSLAAIKMLLETRLSSSVSPPPEDLTSLETIIDHLADTIKESKRISYLLRPRTLDDFGMIAGVSEFIRACNEFYPDLKIHHRIHIAPNNVPDEVKTALYRVIQEALNNVGKHSRATSAQVELTEDDEEFKLQVADNGIGFDVSTTFDTGNPLQGYGLLGMKERVEICRGTFKVESTPGKGTRLFASIPKNP